MIQFNIFPGGKKRIVTFSYDDGSENDRELISLFNSYGLKSTFHLNGKKYIGMSDAALAETARLYSGHEIACHTVSHGWCANMPAVSVLNETLKDRLILEKIAGYPVCGMSYPSGSYSEESISVMKSCGIVYSRTTLSNRNFILPENFMLWHPTCHHRGALQLTDEFMGNLDSEWKRPLFYTWGHSHELRTEQDWDNMKRICETLAGNEKIWYATNIEIYRYMTDCRRLVVSADENIIYNPTATVIWIEKDKKDIIKVPAGTTVKLN